MISFKIKFFWHISSYRSVTNSVTFCDNSGDNVCIICREEIHQQQGGGGAKRLPCSHVFHAACLRSWFQRQQTCPTCRSDILAMRPTAAGTAPAAAAATPAAAAAQQQANAPAQPQGQLQQQGGCTYIQGAKTSCHQKEVVSLCTRVYHLVCFP